MISEQELQQRLTSLATAVAWPEVRDVVDDVTAAVRPDRRITPVRPSLSRPRLRLAVAAVAILVVAATVLVASPAARVAVARLLGFPGIEVEVGPPPTALDGLDLGRKVSLDEARAIVDFPVRVLDPDVVGAQPTISIDEGVAGGIVHLAYPSTPALPATPVAGVGALLTQFRGGDDADFVKRTLGGAGRVSPTEVDGEFALWVTGPSHVLVRRDDGRQVREEARLSANALLWTAQGVTYRLETTLDVDEAVLLAESLQ